MDENLKREIWAFMDEHRARALWWMPSDYYPQNVEQARDVLRAIARRCTRDAWIRTRQLMQRLASQ